MNRMVKIAINKKLHHILNAVGVRYSALLLFVCITVSSMAQNSPLDERITIESRKVSLYEALNIISEVIGYNFVYDSKDIDSDSKVRLEARNERVSSIISRIIQNPNIRANVIDKYILLSNFKEINPRHADSSIVDRSQPIVVKGRIFDKETKEFIPYATIGVAELGIGTISNMDGFFVLQIPSKQSMSAITISHLGYKSKIIPVELLSGQQVDIYIEPQSISIQEVIIRNVDPVALIEKSMAQKGNNYGDKAVYLTSFYREGVEKNSNILSYSEAVFKVYKSSYTRSPDLDQVKLLKSRKAKRGDQSDTLIVKMKGGINASLSLDIVKSIPDFLDREYMSNYRYTKTDIVTLDSLLVYAISFEQREGNNEALFKGVLYITMDSLAILGSDFEIDSRYITKSSSQLVVHKSRGVNATPTRASYSVRYKIWNDRYYLSHIRCDLDLKVKKRSRLFSSNFHTFLEMVVIRIENENVVRFDRDEIVKSNTVFSDLEFSYDDKFWREFNFIAPEESLQESLRKIVPQIENLEGTN